MSKKELLQSGFNRIQNLSTHFKPVVKTRSDEQNGSTEPITQSVATQIEESLRSTTIDDSVSETDTVQNIQCTEQTVSIRDTVKSNFTQVPNWILRAYGLFTDPTDFMVYLHLFTFSYGFNKTRASMSQTQLMGFTGCSKNCIKRSLDRLEKQGLIEQWEDFEHGRVSRVWKVNLPKDPKGSKKTESKSNTVQTGQSPALTDSVSKTDTPTVSNLDTTQYIKQINPKHTLPESLNNYFLNLKPERKLNQEQRAFEELLREFSLEQIESAFLHIQKHGIGEHREKPHSPMGYLAVAMESVLEKTQKSIKQKLIPVEQKNTVETEDTSYEAAKVIFQETFKTEEDQKQFFNEFSKKYPYLSPDGDVLKRLAITSLENLENRKYK
ncbi:MAG: helix-turn-helix domain-containing protein [Xanthomonadaceae bacterium]|nr:helix-turn-helix domain-containing protein [Xanthomonadaceae bacterium]